MIDHIEEVVRPFEPISLTAINERAALQTRAENKYFVPWQVFVEFADELSTTHTALEIKGKRVFLYDTYYFDTPELDSYNGHLQGRRKRFKCRSRIYVDSALCVFELKLKGGRGETIKHRINYTQTENKQVNSDAMTFLQEQLSAAYEMDAPTSLVPMLRTYYYRVTLAAKDTDERMTCDFNVVLGDGERWHGEMDSNYSLVEVKSGNGRSSSDLLLWKMGLRPTGSSKYCLGMNLMRPDLHVNRFTQIRKDLFWPTSAPKMVSSPAQRPASMPNVVDATPLTTLHGAPAAMME